MKRRPRRRGTASRRNDAPSGIRESRLKFPTTGVLAHPAVQLVYSALDQLAELFSWEATPTDDDGTIILRLLRSGRSYLHLFYAVGGITSSGRNLDWRELEREFEAYRAIGRNMLRIIEPARWIDISDAEGAADFVEDFKERVDRAPNPAEPQVRSAIDRLRFAVSGFDKKGLSAMKRVGNIEEYLERHLVPPLLPDPKDPYLGEGRQQADDVLVGWKMIGASITRRTGGERKSDRTLREEFKARGIQLRHDGPNRHEVRVKIAELDRAYGPERGSDASPQPSAVSGAPIGPDSQG